MNTKRKVKGKDFLNDLRSGFSPDQLMEKYELSAGGLRNVFRRILDASAIKKSEVEALPNLYTGVHSKSGLRRFPRKRLNSLVLYDNADLTEGGEVIDVSERGMRITGLRVELGDERTFIARSRVPGERWPFVFEAVCRWVDKRPAEPKKWVAGLEISRISNLDAKQLEDLRNDLLK